MGFFWPDGKGRSGFCPCESRSGFRGLLGERLGGSGFKVIRSVIVGASNAASNVLQLKSLGVPFTAMGRGFKRKLPEIHRFQKNRRREMEIVALLGGTTDKARRRRLESELTSIEDANKRLTIWPLIEAGELSTI